jgi:small subunit ribosomal protein S16
MLTIRLQRAGKRNKPEFRIVLAEKESSAAKKFTEILGHYNPRTKDFAIKEDRLQYWIAQHVTLSPTAHNLLVTKKLVQAPKVKAFSIPAKKVEEKSAEKAGEKVEQPAAAAPVDEPDAEETATAAEPAVETPPAEASAPETPVQ